MPLVVAFISQKGGVGKSTLARGLATFAVANGSKTKVADLDLQQRTAIVWETTRARHGVKPAVDVQPFDTVKDAFSAAKSSDLLILDIAGKIADGASEAAQSAHLLVQPTSPSSDDLHISVLVFLAMERVGVARDKLAFALCRVLSAAEEKYARSYLGSFGYTVLDSSIPEHLGYREVMRAGRSITETDQEILDGPAKTLMLDILRLAERNGDKKPRPRRSGRS
jgi:chromosome partitioning protein